MSDLEANRPTMKDVAREVGCDPSTVSLALRGSPRISDATRRRVIEVAKNLGYSIHPMISAWVSARRGGRLMEALLPLIYLTCHPAGFRWQKFPHFVDVFEGAKKRAAMHGFSLTEIRYSDYAKNPRRLDQVLTTRNVQGIIIGPAGRMHEVTGLDWSHYAMVTIGYGLIAPPVHRVTEDEYLVLRLAFESCLSRGYRRIGLAFLRKHNRERRERWTGAFMCAQQSLVSPQDRVPMYFKDGRSTREEVAPWLAEHRPEIVLTDFPEEWTDGPIPFMAFASPATYPVAGVYENSPEIGQSATDLLVSMIMRNERGLPSNRHTVLVEPVIREVAAEMNEPVETS